MFDYISEDLRRYFVLAGGEIGWFGKVKIVMLTQGIWALAVYRLGSWCVERKGSARLLARLILPLVTILQKITEICTGISIAFTTRIGKGFYIGHFGGIILGREVVLGEYCNISQGVTIGQAGRGKKQMSPTIGDRVYIGPGAKIFGGIRIGNDVAIGANAVVTEDIPDKAVVVGVAARIISYEGSENFVIF